MAQKFGNARWVKEGYFDDRMAEVVVGQITFAALGIVDFLSCWRTEWGK